MSDNIHPVEEDSQIVLYQPDESISLQVRLDEETVWLTQAQMVELFGSSKANISEHISNIYQQQELLQEATVRNFRTVRKEGNLLYRPSSLGEPRPHRRPSCHHHRRIRLRPHARHPECP